MRVLVAKVFAAEQRMEVFVQLQGTETVKIPFAWKAKDKNPVPPPNWYAVIEAEVRQYQNNKRSPKTLSRILRGR